tara:strand:+ start:177 stop:443 length:267 start_codon:yes stop_codon:yes gene_type:complete
MKATEFLKNKGVDPEKIGLEHFDVDCLSHYDLVNYLDEYANIEVMTELENIKGDIRLLHKENARPLCCDDIDELIRQLRILQLEQIKK